MAKEKTWRESNIMICRNTGERKLQPALVHKSGYIAIHAEPYLEHTVYHVTHVMSGTAIISGEYGLTSRAAAKEFAVQCLACNVAETAWQETDFAETAKAFRQNAEFMKLYFDTRDRNSLKAKKLDPRLNAALRQIRR